MKIPSILILISTICCSIVLAAESNEFSTILLDRPIWASGLENASWLLGEKENPTKSFAVLNFSATVKGVPPEGIERKEDDIGRSTRSLPLYLAERINIETTQSANNYFIIKNNVGPVVSGAQSDPEEFLGFFKNSPPPTYIITGHLEKDFGELRKKITISLFDTSDKKTIFTTTETSFLNSDSDLAATIAKSFLEDLGRHKICSFSPNPNYKRPPDELLSPYLIALGQLFTQSLAQNKDISAESIWGEDDMLEWYLRLSEYMTDTDTAKVMYFKGIIASIDYNGKAYKNHIHRIQQLIETESSDSVLKRLSPLLSYKLSKETKAHNTSNLNQKTSDPKYQEWLLSLSNKNI